MSSALRSADLGVPASEPTPSGLWAARCAARIQGRHGPLEYVKGGTNEVYLCEDLVLRAPRLGRVDTAALELADTLAALAPVLVGPHSQRVYRFGGRDVASWVRVERNRPTEQNDLLRCAANLHAIDSGSLPTSLPHWEAGAQLQNNAHRLPAPQRSIIRELLKLAQMRDRELRALPLGRSVLAHHDLKSVNVIVTADGPRLLDLDELCLAPAALDLTHATDPQWPTNDQYPGIDTTAGRRAVELARHLRRLDWIGWLIEQGHIDAAARLLHHTAADEN